LQIEVVLMNVWQKERNARTIVFSMRGVVDQVEGSGWKCTARKREQRVQEAKNCSLCAYVALVPIRKLPSNFLGKVGTK
jgi:hypothetical protein